MLTINFKTLQSKISVNRPQQYLVTGTGECHQTGNLQVTIRPL